MALQASTQPALAQARPPAQSEAICQVYGGPLVLDDGDFKAVAAGGITREKFAALAPNAFTRKSVCDTRKLWRLVKAGKAGWCDFMLHYRNYAIVYFDKSEVPAVHAAQEKLVTKQCP